MKTVFITISDGEVSKSILQSDIFPRLSARMLVVLLVPKHKLAYFSERYASERVSAEVMPRARSSRFEEFWADLFLYSLHTKSIRIKIEYSYASGGSRLGKYIKLLLWNLGRFRGYRAACRWFYHVLPERSFDALLELYHPDAVFAANLTSMEDARLLKAARRRGVRSIGMPKGWDNLTLKTFLPVCPDMLLVETEAMRSDALALDVPAGKIKVVGFPKFDPYADRGLIIPRAEFMRRFGFDPSKKLILYAGAGDQLAPHDEEILSDFLEAIAQGTVVGAPQVLVRPHPKYKYRAEILPRYPFWALDRPGTAVAGYEAAFEFDRADVIHLMNSLYHCDLLIHTASTLGVEAAIFDKPSITLAYDGHAHMPPELSIARYYDYVHFKRVLATHGMKAAYIFDELVRYTNGYLANPLSDHAGRQKIAEENAYHTDGRAGERVAEAVLELVEPAKN